MADKSEDKNCSTGFPFNVTVTSKMSASFTCNVGTLRKQSLSPGLQKFKPHMWNSLEQDSQQETYLLPGTHSLLHNDLKRMWYVSLSSVLHTPN